MKNRGVIISLIVFITIIIIILIGLLVYLLIGNNKYGFKIPFIFNSGSSVSKNLLMEESVNNIADININTEMGEIEIKTHDETYIKYAIYMEQEYQDKLEIKNNESNLSLDIIGNLCKSFVCFNIKTPKIIVFVPSDYAKKITVKNNFGNINIENLINATLDVENNCGKTSIDGANVVMAKNDYGDVEIGKANIINVEQNCGEVDIDYGKNVTVSNQYGNIKIGKIEGELVLENNCGDIIIDNIILDKSSSIKDDLGNIKIGFTNEIFIDASNDLGNIKINNNYRQSDIILSIKNNCGDIKVNN